jgi:uncharacterized protein (DUF2267 family)
MANRPYDAEYEPRPGEQAASDQQRYRQLLQRLARHGLGNAERAESTAVAVLCSVQRRLSGGEARDLNDELPWALRDLLRRCELHPRARPERFGAGELVAQVAEALAIDTPEAERVIRAVLSEVRGMLSEKEASDVVGQLPPDLAALWAAPA